MNRRLGAFIAMLSVLLTMVLVPGTSASATSGDFLPELKNSASLTTPIVVQGHVRQANGQAAKGLPLQLLAWPADLSHLTKGDSVKLQPVAKAVTTSTGDYSLRIADPALVQPLARQDGTVNIDLAVAGDGRIKPVAFSKVVLHSSSITTRTATFAGGSPRKLDVDLKTLGMPIAGQGAGAESGLPSSAVMPKACSSTLVENLGLVVTNVGYTQNFSDGVTTTMTYTQGSDSTIGVGVSATGTAGSYTASGQSSIKSTILVNFPPTGTRMGTFFRSNFQFGKFLVICISTGGGVPSSTSWYEARADGFVGGTVDADTPVPTNAVVTYEHYCVGYQPNSAATIDTSQAVTFTNGAFIGAQIGINLTASTGYNKNASFRFAFTKARQLCGRYAYPTGLPAVPGYMITATLNQTQGIPG